MTKEPDIEVYLKVMVEIKRRTKVIDAFLGGQSSAVYAITQVESVYLQIRMILELIALASLAANKAIFEENLVKFHKHWHPSKILRDIEHLNPGYYPKPIEETLSSKPGMKSDLKEIKDGFLTKADLIETHGRIGGILHARNPFGRDHGLRYLNDAIPDVMAKIVRLLSCHEIRLLGDHDFFYLIHMQENRDDHVHCYRFQRMDSQ
jgi:hypothetical protein